MTSAYDIACLFLGLSAGLFLPVISLGVALGLGTLAERFQNRRSLPRTTL